MSPVPERRVAPEETTEPADALADLEVPPEEINSIVGGLRADSGTEAEDSHGIG